MSTFGLSPDARTQFTKSKNTAADDGERLRRTLLLNMSCPQGFYLRGDHPADDGAPRCGRPGETDCCQAVDNRDPIVARDKARIDDMLSALAERNEEFSRFASIDLKYGGDENIQAMREAVREASGKLESAFMQEAMDPSAAPAGLCYALRDTFEANDRYGFQKDADLPHQIIAAAHMTAFFNMPGDFRAGWLFHGMGTGKTTTMGMVAHNCTNLEIETQESAEFVLAHAQTPKNGNSLKQRRRYDGVIKGFRVTFFVNDDGGAGDSNKEKIIQKYFETILRKNGITLGPSEPRGGEVSRLTKSAIMTLRSHPYKQVEPDAKDVSELYDTLTDSFFKWFPPALYKLVDNPSTTTIDQLPPDVGQRCYHRPHLVIIDEAQTFFNNPAAFKILCGIRIIFKQLVGQGNKLRFLFASGTPFMDDAAAGRFREFMKFRDDLYTVSYFEDINSAFKPRVSYVKVDELFIHKDTDEVTGVVDGGSARRESLWRSTDGTSIIPPYFKGFRRKAVGNAPVQAVPTLAGALHHFGRQAARAVAEHKVHLKCVIVVPTAYVTDGVDGVQVRRENDAAAEPLFDVIGEYLATAARKLAPSVNGSERYSFEEYDTKKTPEPGQLTYAFYNRYYQAAPAAAGTSARTVFRVNGVSVKSSGAALYGELDEKAISSRATVQERKRVFGLLTDEKPDVQILFVNNQATGKSFVGTSFVYVLHKPTTDTEFRQMIYRGIRICSMVGYPEELQRVTVVTFGFDERDSKTDLEGQPHYSRFKQRFVDEGVYAPPPKPLELTNTEQYAVLRHNFPSAAVAGAPARQRTALTLKSVDEIEDFIMRRSGSDAMLRLLRLSLRYRKDEDRGAALKNLFELLDGEEPRATFQTYDKLVAGEPVSLRVRLGSYEAVQEFLSPGRFALLWQKCLRRCVALISKTAAVFRTWEELSEAYAADPSAFHEVRDAHRFSGQWTVPALDVAPALAPWCGDTIDRAAAAAALAADTKFTLVVDDDQLDALVRASVVSALPVFVKSPAFLRACAPEPADIYEAHTSGRRLAFEQAPAYVRLRDLNAAAAELDVKLVLRDACAVVPSEPPSDSYDDFLDRKPTVSQVLYRVVGGGDWFDSWRQHKGAPPLIPYDVNQPLSEAQDAMVAAAQDTFDCQLPKDFAACFRAYMRLRALL